MERVDPSEQPQDELREEDVTLEDRLDDRVPEGDELADQDNDGGQQ